jgi:hypothetical protein
MVYMYHSMACLECSHKDKEHIFVLLQDVDHSSLVVGYVCQLHIEALSCIPDIGRAENYQISMMT